MLERWFITHTTVASGAMRAMPSESMKPRRTR